MTHPAIKEAIDACDKVIDTAAWDDCIKAAVLAAMQHESVRRKLGKVCRVPPDTTEILEAPELDALIAEIKAAP